MIINSPEKNKIEWQHFQVISEGKYTQFFNFFFRRKMKEKHKSKKKFEQGKPRFKLEMKTL